MYPRPFSGWRGTPKIIEDGDASMPHQLYSINKARIDKAFTLENGLTSIAAPTGSGKTHAVAECITKALMEKKRTKKKLFLYVTPSKVNRNEFRNQLFSLLPARSEARKRILVVESNVDVSESAIKSFDKSGFSFPTSLTEGRNAVETFNDTYKSLVGSIKNLNTINRASGADKIKDNAKQLVQDADSDFRTLVKTAIGSETKKWNKNRGGNLDARQYVETVGRQRWGWVKDFWLLSHLDDFDVLIMTPEKFVSTFDTILDGTQRFTDVSFLKNVHSIVIDESDYVNDSIKNKFCEDAAEGSYNPLILLCDICEMMGEAGTASEWFSNRFQRIAGFERNWGDRLAGMDEAMAQARSVCERHHLNRNLVEDENDGGFDDEGLMFAFNPTDSFGRTIPFVTYDASGKQNILTKNRPKDKKSVRLDGVIRDCQNALHRLAISIRYVALSYKAGKDELIQSWRNGASGKRSSSRKERPISISDAVSTTLNDAPYRTIRGVPAIGGHGADDALAFGTRQPWPGRRIGLYGRRDHGQNHEAHVTRFLCGCAIERA